MHSIHHIQVTELNSLANLSTIQTAWHDLNRTKTLRCKGPSTFLSSSHLEATCPAHFVRQKHKRSTSNLAWTAAFTKENRQ